MAERGYPMPEDVIAVANLADEQLRNLAAQGNDKAGFLLHEREVAAMEARIDALTRNGESKEALLRSDQALAIERSRVRDAVQALYVSSESPYKGYVMAQDASQLNDPSERSATTIAGLLWASQYGDSRASTDAMYAFFKGDAQLQSQQLAALKMLVAVGFDQRRLNCYTSFPNTRIPEKVWNNQSVSFPMPSFLKPKVAASCRMSAVRDRDGPTPGRACDRSPPAACSGPDRQGLPRGR